MAYCYNGRELEGYYLRKKGNRVDSIQRREEMTDRNKDQPSARTETMEGNQPPIEKEELKSEWQFHNVWLLAFFVLSAGGLITLFWCVPSLSTVPVSFYLFAALLALFLWFYFRHDRSERLARIIKKDEVRTLFVEAETVEPRVVGDDEQPTEFEHKRDNLVQEVNRLKRLGSANWTHLEVVPLRQMLVEFYKVHDLSAQAASVLNDLREYAEDSTYRYDLQYFARWDQRVQEAHRKIDYCEETTQGEELAIDNAAERLRAELRTILEHVADYNNKWAEGSTLLRGLIAFCSIAIPYFIIIALSPVCSACSTATCAVTTGHLTLGPAGWALLGMSGSLTAALLAIRKANIVEVGNTEGKKEMWGALLATVLGLVAGLVMYGLIAGGLFAGSFFPDIPSKNISDFGLTIFWALAAGYSFERVLSRMTGLLSDSIK